MSKTSQDVVITCATRTGIGKYNGMWNKVQAHDLGKLVIKDLLKQTTIDHNQIDQVILGQVLTSDVGQNPARQAAIGANIPNEKVSYIVNQVCGSGLRAIVSAYQSILLKESKIIVAGGQESMSCSNKELMIKDGLIDAFNNYHMGVTAENVAEKWNISREDQDNFSLSSQKKAQDSIKQEKFKDEIIKDEKYKSYHDEHPRLNISLQDISKLKPAFKENGTVTPGNSSGINDGAAGLLLMSYKKAKMLGLDPLVKIVGWGQAGVDPSIMGTGPIPAIKNALSKIDWSINEIDIFELNEAFASQSLACIKDLKIDQNKVNIDGGALALGHPLGATGARITGKAAQLLKRENKRYALATQCIGLGMGIATIIESVE